MSAPLQKDGDSGLDYVLMGDTVSPKHALVLLHGSGTDHKDMQSVGEMFKDKIPSDTLIIIPNAPYRMLDLAPPEQQAEAMKQQPNFDWEGSRNWFPAINFTEDMDEMARIAYVRAKMKPVGERINKLVDNVLTKHGLDEKDLVIYGFSAGGIAALVSGLQRHETPCAGVISHSGYFYGVQRAVSKPSVTLVVGDKEIAEGAPLKPLHEMTKEILSEENEVVVTEHVCKNLGHGINKEALAVVTATIRGAFGKNHIDLSIEFEAEPEPEAPRPAPPKKKYKL